MMNELEIIRATLDLERFNNLQDDISNLQNKIVNIPSDVYTTKDELFKGAFTDLDNALTKLRKALQGQKVKVALEENAKNPIVIEMIRSLTKR